MTKNKRPHAGGNRDAGRDSVTSHEQSTISAPTDPHRALVEGRAISPTVVRRADHADASNSDDQIKRWWRYRRRTPPPMRSAGWSGAIRRSR